MRNNFSKTIILVFLISLILAIAVSVPIVSNIVDAINKKVEVTLFLNDTAYGGVNKSFKFKVTEGDNLYDNLPQTSDFEPKSTKNGAVGILKWSTTAEGNDTFDGVILEKTTLYAQWAPAIIFNMGENDNPIPAIIMNEGASINIPTLSKEGYEFLGWTNASGNSFSSSTMPVSGAVITPKWHLYEYDVVFDAQGGVMKANYPTSFSCENTISINNMPYPTKDGHVFAGWYTKENGQGTWYKEIGKKQQENLTLYAYWCDVSEINVSAPSDCKVSKTWKYGASETHKNTESVKIEIPSALKNMQSIGLLQISVTVSGYAEILHRANKYDINTLETYVYIDGEKNNLATVSAKGGGWPSHAWDPYAGAWDKSGDVVIGPVPVKTKNSFFYVGYEYILTATGQIIWTGQGTASDYNAGINYVKCIFSINA